MITSRFEKFSSNCHFSNFRDPILTHLFKMHRLSPLESEEHHYKYTQKRGELQRLTSRDDTFAFREIFENTLIFSTPTRHNNQPHCPRVLSSSWVIVFWVFSTRIIEAMHSVMWNFWKKCFRRIFSLFFERDRDERERDHTNSFRWIIPCYCTKHIFQWCWWRCTMWIEW